MRTKIGLIIAVFLICVVLTGCRRPIENPESLDPIYADLDSLARTAEMAADTEKRAIEQLEIDIAALPPRDPVKRRSIREKYAREKSRVIHLQNAEYYRIRAEQRKEFARREYLKAFEKELPWPDPKEIEEYKASKALRAAPKNWEERIPKLTRHQKPKPPTSSKDAAKKDGSEQ